MAENITLSDERKSALLQQVIAHRDEAIDNRGEFPSRHSERYRRFLADPTLRTEGPWPNAPRLFIPITRSILERLHSEIWQTLFANDEAMRLVAFGEEDAEKAQLASRFLRWTLRQTMNWARISSMAIFDALLDSVAVCKVWQYTPPWNAPSPEARRYLSRMVRIDVLDIETLLVPPDAEGLQYPEARYLAQEMYLNEDDLLRMKRQGYDVPGKDQILEDSQDITERRREELEREGENAEPYMADTIRFVESYERFVIDKRSGLAEDVIVSWFPESQADDNSSDTGRLSRVRRLVDVFPQDDRPRRPFFDVTIWPQPRQWKGLNVPDRMESMQDLINRLHEQMVNFGEISMLPFVFANTFMTGDLPDLRQVEPGSIVPINDLTGVQFAPTRSLNRHFADQIQMALANIERDMNVNDFNLGRASDRANAPKTASATLALLQESRRSFSMISSHIARQFESMLAFHFRLWQEILPPNTLARVSPPEEGQPEEEDVTIFGRLFSDEARHQQLLARGISKEDISGLYDVEMDINPEAAFDRQTMVNLFQLVAPFIQDFPLGQRELLSRIWSVFGQRGFDQIWPQDLARLQTQQRNLAIQAQILRLQMLLEQATQPQPQQPGEEMMQGGGMMPGGEQPSPTAVDIPPELMAMLQGGGQNGGPL